MEVIDNAVELTTRHAITTILHRQQIFIEVGRTNPLYKLITWFKCVTSKGIFPELRVTHVTKTTQQYTEKTDEYSLTAPFGRLKHTLYLHESMFFTKTNVPKYRFFSQKNQHLVMCFVEKLKIKKLNALLHYQNPGYKCCVCFTWLLIIALSVNFPCGCCYIGARQDPCYFAWYILLHPVSLSKICSFSFRLQWSYVLMSLQNFLHKLLS